MLALLRPWPSARLLHIRHVNVAMVREDLFLWPNGRGQCLLSRYAALAILAAGHLPGYLMCM